MQLKIIQFYLWPLDMNSKIFLFVIVCLALICMTAGLCKELTEKEKKMF